MKNILKSVFPVRLRGAVCAGVAFAFFSAGCITTDVKTHVPPAGSEEPRLLLSVAEKLGMKPAYGKTPGDIATDIRLAIEDAERPPSICLTDASVERLCDAATTQEEEALLAYQEFIKKVHGKRILILPDDE